MSQQLTFDLNVDNKSAIDSINTFFDAFEAGVKGVGKKMDDQFKQKNVNIEMRLEGGKLVAKEINNAASAGNKLEKAADAISGKFGKTAKEVNNSISLLRTLISSTNKYKDGTKELNDDWVKLVKLLKEARKEAADLDVPDSMQRSITGANIAAGLALDAIRALIGGVQNLINEGIQMEVLMIQLKGFTGSAEEAQVAFDEFLRIAASTPFNVKQVAEGARTMMGFGLSTSEATQRVEQLAIVASATGGDLNHMSRNLGQIQANQRAYTRDLMQFANQGIPIYQMLADVLGVTTQQVRKLAEDGAIGFSEVSAALDKMTEKGSAFRKIAEEMDKTIAARIEALQGTIMATSGKFIEMIQAIDTAVGGPLEKTFLLLINIVKGIGGIFDAIKHNAETLAPLFVTLATIITGTIGVAIVQNISAIVISFKAWIAKLLATKAAVMALNVAKALFLALAGNVGALLLVAGGATLAFVAFKNATKDAAKEGADLNKLLEEEKFTPAADAAKTLAFQTKDLTGKTKELVKEKRKEFTELQKNYNLAISAMDRAMGYLENEAQVRKGVHEEKISQIKEELDAEKSKMDELIDKAKTVHDQKMEGLKNELQAVRDRYDEELAKLDQQSVYAKELEDIRRRELQEKLRSGELSKKETLEIKEQLYQMDNKVKRRELLAEKAKDEEEVQKRIAEQEEKHKKALEDIEKEYEDRITALEDALTTEQGSIDTINKELTDQRNMIAQFKAEELAAIYANRDAAVAAIQEQIAEANRLKTAMKEAYDQAKAAQKAAQQTGGSNNLSATGGNVFTGGPVSGGTTYTVNELGKEAFLSASGRLSMIDAPAWGSWKAPSSGTVIPAHLTKQLDIPSGGINLNRAAGANAAKAGGGMAAMVRAVQGAMGGDTFHQNVTVQSHNPAQTANNMMVNMIKQRHHRMR